MAWLETVVCSSKKKVDARFLRILNAHQELKRRQDGCIAAWAARSVDGQPLFLVQSLYRSRKSLQEISKLVSIKMDSKYGSLESFMVGPPLVGIFEVDEDEFPKQFQN
ncbi:antibiotic biosynthesis monooxygenase [Candidatus Poseidoniales archaeon]|nr:antibiotic biosynthesis monooxygenase [Candidatus Poseidoniales archaeon]MDB2348687.1 antibiotic biosynthesis monooxygenase [Candidatus Poseidoniales archaeon]MDB2367436.1 antibiotic biosynthesis monooxygenase [Candidatus Poseidoniales archaeon]MDB2671605.1 antibiotic biosynthesis monooxygenase [Candidatus Poseidoniales archaeon]